MDEMLSSKEVSELLGVNQNTLQKWRSRNTGPRYVKFGGNNASAVRYYRVDIEKFLKSHTIAPITNKENHG
jgi:predicted DNA-binding transcriptional regulator AlpA